MTDTWLSGIIRKRTPDGLRVLSDLLEAGLRKGETSAADLRDVRYAEPNIIGATFRLLPRFGFRHTDRRVKMTAARKHGRRVDVWELIEPGRARRGLDRLRSVLCPLKESAQMELF